MLKINLLVKHPYSVTKIAWVLWVLAELSKQLARYVGGVGRCRVIGIYVLLNNTEVNPQLTLVHGLCCIDNRGDLSVTLSSVTRVPLRVRISAYSYNTIALS